jgi:hypothetical protein
VADVSFAVNFLNVTFGDDDLGADSAIRQNPLLQMFSIEEEGGSTVEEKFYLNGPRGFSSNLADAQQVAATGGSSHFRWQHPFGKREGSIQVDYVDIMQSRKSQAAANQALEAEMDKGFASEGQNISDLLIGRAGLAGGFGEYEETASGVYPAFAIRFADPSDARKYQVGDQIVVSTTDGTSAGSLVGETGYVLRRDVSEGWIQVASLDDITTAANPGSWVDDVNYYVYRLGEFTTAGSPDNIITSIERFLPSAVASDTLHNVDRSVDSALSGARLTAAEEVGSILQRSRKLITKMFSRYGSDAKMKRKLVCVLNPEDHGVAEEELISKLQREVGVTTEEGYESFMVRTAAGNTNFVSEPSKNKGRGFILDQDRLKLYSPNGKLFEPVKVGGNIIHLMPGVNKLEVRTVAKLATGIGAPYMHGSFSTSVS